jgi:hypothetical protein
MFARVVTWEGGDADAIRRAAADISSRAATGPPEGVKSTGFTMLVDPEGGRTMMIGLFETQDDLRDAQPVLEAMDPGEGLGGRSDPRVYDVAVEARMNQAAR